MRIVDRTFDLVRKVMEVFPETGTLVLKSEERLKLDKRGRKKFQVGKLWCKIHMARVGYGVIARTEREAQMGRAVQSMILIKSYRGSISSPKAGNEAWIRTQKCASWEERRSKHQPTSLRWSSWLKEPYSSLALLENHRLWRLKDFDSFVN